jgi:hypothetical protein
VYFVRLQGVVGEVVTEAPLEVPLVDDDNVVEALPADRADQPLDERVLPWAPCRGADLREAQPGHPVPEDLTEDRETAMGKGDGMVDHATQTRPTRGVGVFGRDGMNRKHSE